MNFTAKMINAENGEMKMMIDDVVKLEEMISKMEDPRVECVHVDHSQLTEWLKELKELRESIGAFKLSNMKEALALMRTLKAELNGWEEDPFCIIAEVCGAVTDCRRCQWYEKCPFPKNYGSYPEDWRD